MRNEWVEWLNVMKYEGSVLRKDLLKIIKLIKILSNNDFFKGSVIGFFFLKYICMIVRLLCLCVYLSEIRLWCKRVVF